ncbi:unnamed protein product [Scytosiphon promiscuus]
MGRHHLDPAESARWVMIFCHACLRPKTAIVRQSFEGDNRNTSSTEGDRRDPEDARNPLDKRRQSTPMAVEGVGKVNGGGRTLGSHHRHQLSSPTKKTARFRPSLDRIPADPRANQRSDPLVANERSNTVRRGSAPRDVPDESVSATRARVRDLQARGGLSQRSAGVRSLRAAEARKGDSDSAVFVGHSEQVLSLAHRKDILFSAAADGTAKAWDTYSQQCLATYEGHQSPVWGIEVTDRTLITGSADGSVRFWDIETAQCLHVIDLRSSVRDVVVVGGFLAVATSNPGVEVIDLNSMKRHGILEGHLMAVSALTSLRRRAHLVSGSHDTFISRVWDPATGNCEALLGGHGGTVGALCTVSWPSSPPAHDKADPSGEAEGTEDALIVSGSGDATVRVWGQAVRGIGAGEWTCRAVLGGHRHGVWAVHSSPFSGVFASGGGDATIKLWAPIKKIGEVSTGSKIKENGERTSGENEQQDQAQRWECVGGVRGAAGAVGAIFMSEKALVFGTSEALIARFPLQKCMPG